MTHYIEAVTVNHNTSRYMELMLRSLFARHPSNLNLSVTVFDNASQDDMTELRAYADVLVQREMEFCRSKVRHYAVAWATLSFRKTGGVGGVFFFFSVYIYLFVV